MIAIETMKHLRKWQKSDNLESQITYIIIFMCCSINLFLSDTFFGAEIAVQKEWFEY